MLRLPNLVMSAAIVAVFSATTLQSQETRTSNVIVRELASPNATSADHFGLIVGVRGLSDGSLLVNDARRYQLVLLDSALRRRITVLDSVAVGGQRYARGGNAPIIAYAGDSTLYVDAGATSLVMVAPNGSIGRVMAPPVSVGWNTLTRFGAAMDARGNLVYRVDERRVGTQSEDTAQIRKAFTPPDSFFIVRANFATRTLDTIGRVKLSKIQQLTVRFEPSRTVVTSFPTVLPTQDDYAVLSDGSIAIVRSHDYHVDIIQSNGERIAGPKLPFDWKRLSDAEKQALIDSVRAKEASDKAAATKELAGRAGNPSTVNLPNDAADRVAIVGNPKVFEAGELRKDQIVDYYPPIRSGALKADMNANLWILPTTSAQSNNGELIYDIVNNRGELKERVRIPAGRSVAGFGANGEVYLMLRDANGWQLERTFVRR